jgi:hypothetical protein
MTDAYDMRSNLKNKPGAQGTLFQVKDKGLLNPQQRWPKGYTPERQREVSDALSQQTSVYPTMRVYPPRPESHVRARLTDAIARSTVPTEHLAGLRTVHDQPEHGHEATYWPGRQTMAVNLFGKHENQGIMGDEPYGSAEPDAGAKNLLHELGHHVDHMVTRESARLNRENKNILYAANGKGYADAGEAVADNYYVEHYRGPGRKGAQVTQGRYEDSGLAEHMPAYREVRPALQPRQFDTGQDMLPQYDVRKHAAQMSASREATAAYLAERRAAKTPWRNR